MKLPLAIFVLIAALGGGAVEPQVGRAREILFVAGPPSHGSDEHEFPRGCALLAEALSASGLPVTARVVVGWPEDQQLVEATDVLVIFSDGLGDHVAKGRSEMLRARHRAGRALVVLHFALEPPDDDPELREVMLQTVGGVFEAGWSVNPIWRLHASPAADHPIARGVGPLALDDEWYYHLRFRDSPDLKVVLAAHPGPETLGADGPRSGNPAVRAALDRDEPQVVAWTNEPDQGPRGFGFTGGHFHRNWYQDDFRTLVLNGIVWAAGLDVPPDGVPSPAPLTPVFSRIDEAIARGDIDDVRRHLSADRASVNRAASGRMPPLHQAILRRQPAIARLLLEQGADIDQLDTAGRAPLHLAVIRGETELAELLLHRKADMTVQDQQGWTPLHHAAAKKQPVLARLLLQHGCDPNIRSAAGGTPLHEAAASGAVPVARLLLEAGTNPSHRSATGVTALDLAREYGRSEVVELLATWNDQPVAPAPKDAPPAPATAP